MTDHASLRKIIEETDEEAPRLVDADWLEGHGDRAEFIRLQIEKETDADGASRRLAPEERERRLTARSETDNVVALARIAGRNRTDDSHHRPARRGLFVVPNHCPSCGGKTTPADLHRGKCDCGGLLVSAEPMPSTGALNNRGFYVLLGTGLLVAALLSTLGAGLLAGVRDVTWATYSCRLCAMLLSVRAVGLVIQAFRQERWQWYGISYVVTTYFCPGSAPVARCPSIIRHSPPSAAIILARAAACPFPMMRERTPRPRWSRPRLFLPSASPWGRAPVAGGSTEQEGLSA
jgi:uncharacterized protein (TIGR02996 family)